MDLQTLYYAIAVILVLVGIAGTILPALPGLPLVFAGMLLGAWAGDFAYIGVPTLVVLGVLTAFSLVVDFWATALGAKRVGASGKAVAGAVIGTFVGIFFGPIGLFAGPFIGALAGELLHVRRLVILVNDFQTKYSLNDIFEGDDSLETAVFIYYKGHLLMLLEQLLPDESA